MVRRGGGGGGHTKPPPPPRRGGPLFFSRADVDALAEPVPDGPTTAALLSLSSEYGMTVGAGLIERAADGSLYNSYVVAMPDGRVERHRKLHAFEGPHMKSGDSYTVFDTPHGQPARDGRHRPRAVGAQGRRPGRRRGRVPRAEGSRLAHALAARARARQ